MTELGITHLLFYVHNLLNGTVLIFSAAYRHQVVIVGETHCIDCVLAYAGYVYRNVQLAISKIHKCSLCSSIVEMLLKCKHCNRT